MEAERIYRAGPAAKIVGVSTSYFHELARNGSIPFRLICGTRYFTADALRGFALDRGRIPNWRAGE